MNNPLSSEVIDELIDVLGKDNLLMDQLSRELASSDIFLWPEAVLAQAVLRPETTEQLSKALVILSKYKIPIVPRGAGLSYTASVVPFVPGIVIDCRNFNQIEINAADMYAVVGAGTTWEALADAVKPLGLRAAQISPISGSHSTVGGTASQNIPGGLEHFIGLTVALPDGAIIQTGSASQIGNNSFSRYCGPDLTGLFLGDCGAFGVKVSLVVRLTVDRPACFSSFQFKTASDMMDALITLRQRELVSRAFSMDQLKAKSSSKVDAEEALKIVKAVASDASSILNRVKNLAHLALGRNELLKSNWSLHLTTEALTTEIANAQMDLAREVCIKNGLEIDNFVPKTMRAKPYSIRGMVGPDGERWVPIHGVLPLSKANECMQALQAALKDKQSMLQSVGVSYSWIISTIGAYITIEPMFYWMDQLDEIHITNLSPRNQNRFSGRKVNQPARDLVREMREHLRLIMGEFGAVHTQMGRFYPYLNLLTPDSKDFVERIKKALDPNGLMNPGVLGLS